MNNKIVVNTIALSLIELLCVADVFAGHNEGKKTNCKWWRKRYWTKAHLYVSSDNYKALIKFVKE